MPVSLQPVAKAVAALLAPLVVSAALWALSAIGVEATPDPVWIESAIISTISAIWVYVQRNTEPNA
jgi:hypothetical protein